MNSDNIILFATDNPPLINKDDLLEGVELDANFVNIYNDLLELSNTGYVTAFNNATTYAVGEFVTYGNRLWQSIAISTGVTPSTDIDYWIDVFPSFLSHLRNRDTILDEGGENEVTASELRAFIDGGLTTTTNLSISDQGVNSLKINSSTGTDVTLLGATGRTAGLLNAENFIKLSQQSGTNSGDQTLESLGAEPTVNKVTDFTTIDNITFPTTEAVNVQITDAVPPLVEAVMEGYQKTTSSTALTFMFSGTNSDISTYETAFDLGNFVAGASANNGGVSTSTTPTLQVAFATEIGKPNLTVIPIGNIICHFETQKSSGANSYYSNVKIYKRNLAGTETLLLTSDNSTVTASNDLIQNTVTAVNSSIITLLSTDRLVFKIYSVMSIGTATITSYYDDATMTRVELPYTVDLTKYAPIDNPSFTTKITTPEVIISSETASTIASFDGSKKVKSLSTSTYPSLTELSYIKGLTGAVGTLATQSTIPVVIQLACSDESTALTTGTAKVTFRMPHAMTLTAVRASLNVAGTTSGITIIDINEGGTSILSTKLTIDLTEKTSTTAATPAVISDASLADDAEITIDIDAISGGATEKGLKITLIGNRTI